MKINEILNRAVRLVGFGEEYLAENDNSDLRSRGLSAINATLSDLCEMPPCDRLSDEIDMSPAYVDACVYGTAMFICIYFGDADKGRMFSNMYIDRRAKAKGEILRVADRLPKTEATQ